MTPHLPYAVSTILFAFSAVCLFTIGPIPRIALKPGSPLKQMIDGLAYIRRNRLVLAVDHIGMKPLYLHESDGLLRSDTRLEHVSSVATSMLDYGHHTFVKPIIGSFAIVDETDETHGPETSTTGICLVPSLDALTWILRKVGFASVEVLPVPADGYEQLRFGKRVMVAARA